MSKRNPQHLVGSTADISGPISSGGETQKKVKLHDGFILNSRSIPYMDVWPSAFRVGRKSAKSFTPIDDNCSTISFQMTSGTFFLEN